MELNFSQIDVFIIKQMNTDLIFHQELNFNGQVHQLKRANCNSTKFKADPNISNVTAVDLW